MSFFLLETSDKLVLNAVGIPINNIGLYNVASSFGNYFHAATGAIAQAATPFYVENYSRTDSLEAALTVRRLTFFLQAFFLGITFLVSLWMKEIFEVLIKNKELQQAYPLAVIILMGYNFRPMYLAAINLLLLREHTSALWKVSLVAGIANVLLNFIFVPVFGFQAAAFTTFAALMYMGYAGYFLKEYKEAALINFYPLFWLLLTIVALIFVYGIADIELTYKVTVTAVVGVLGIVSLFIFKLRKLT